MFAKRFMSAVVLLAFAVVALVGGGTFLLVVSVVTALAGTYEFLKVDHMNNTVPGYMCYVSVLGFYLMLYWRRTSVLEMWLVLVILLLLSLYVLGYPKYHIHNVGFFRTESEKDDRRLCWRSDRSSITGSGLFFCYPERNTGGYV